MRRRIAVTAVVFAVVVLAAVVPFTFAAEKGMKTDAMNAGTAAATEGQPQMTPEQEAMMAKWAEYATPSENHRVLDAVVGDWTYTSKHWDSPAAPAQETTGTAQAKWILDGHFVEQDVQGEFMGKPFNGTSLMGFDNAGKEFQSIWYDNMGTGFMETSGNYDAASKTITQNGKFNCPLRGNMSVRWVTKFIDSDTYSFEMYGPDEKGTEFKGMEIVYKRKA